MLTGELAPDVTLHFADASSALLSSYRGRAVVLYFYPKDDTPGCTTEAQGFNVGLPAFDAAGAVVIGVSRDSAKSHDRFSTKYTLTFPLVVDEDGAVCEAFGTWVEKSMYGKKYMGIERATFLIDAQGFVVQAWRKVKVPGHVDAVLSAVQTLSSSA